MSVRTFKMEPTLLWLCLLVDWLPQWLFQWLCKVSVCVCLCVCVFGCGHWWLNGLRSGLLLIIERLSSSPSVGMMLSHHFSIWQCDGYPLTPSPHQSTQLWWVPGICWGANSPDHVSPIRVQVGLRTWCPHPLAERHGQASCEFLAWLQEVAYTGSLRLLSEQASWICQVVWPC